MTAMTFNPTSAPIAFTFRILIVHQTAGKFTLLLVRRQSGKIDRHLETHPALILSEHL
jgi:hypothetical protein